jgi:hypothetical protein
MEYLIEMLLMLLNKKQIQQEKELMLIIHRMFEFFYFIF